MASWTPGWGCARERPRIIPQPQQGALKTALEIRDRQLKQLTEENEKLKGDFGQVRKELEGKDEVVQGMRKEMDGLIKQLVSQGSQSDELELKRELEEGRQEIRRLKAELDKAKINGATGEKISQAMEVLVLKKRKDDALQTELGEVMEELEKIREELASMKENEKKLEGDFQRVQKELAKAKKQLENVRKDCEDQLGAMKEKEKMLEGDSQRVRDELAATKEELRKVRKQLVEEEELRKGSEFKLKSIRESFKMIDEGAVGSGARGVDNEAGQGSLLTPSQAGGGVKDKESCHGRSISGKHGLPSSSAPMEPPKKVKLEDEVGSSGKKSTGASSGDGTSTVEVEGGTQHSLEEPVPPVLCITIDSDSDSEPEDGLEETQHQQISVIVDADTSLAFPAQAPGRGQCRVPKATASIPATTKSKSAVPLATPSTEREEAQKWERSPDLEEEDAIGVVVIVPTTACDCDEEEQPGNVEAQVGPPSSTVSAPINEPAGSPSRKDTGQGQSSSNEQPSHTDDAVDDTEPIETTGADPEIDTKITLPVEKLLQHSTLNRNRKVTRRRRQKKNASRNGASRHSDIFLCITIDSDSDSDDGLEETRSQPERPPVHAATSGALPTQAPEGCTDFDLPTETQGRGRRRVPKSKTTIPPSKAAVTRATSSSAEKDNALKRDRSPDSEEEAVEVVMIVSSTSVCNEEGQNGHAEVRGPIPTASPARTEIAQSGSDDDPSPRDIGSVEETEPMESTNADPEIDTKVIPDDTVLQRSTMNRNVPRQRKSRNGKKYFVIPRRVSVALTRVLRHGEDTAKPLYCLCGNRFASPGSLRVHVRYFNREPKRCNICNKAYTSLCNLRLHKKSVHSNASNPEPRKPNNPKLPRRPKKIVEIGRGKEDIHGFSHESSADIPSRSGAGPSPSSRSGATQYFCKCGQQFPGNDGFLEHMNTIKLKGTFKCSWCPVGFSSAGGLRRHQKKFHAVEFSPKTS